MTSRVQKGGAIFKPMKAAKARSSVTPAPSRGPQPSSELRLTPALTSSRSMGPPAVPSLVSNTPSMSVSADPPSMSSSSTGRAPPSVVSDPARRPGSGTPLVLPSRRTSSFSGTGLSLPISLGEYSEPPQTQSIPDPPLASIQTRPPLDPSLIDPAITSIPDIEPSGENEEGVPVKQKRKRAMKPTTIDAEDTDDPSPSPVRKPRKKRKPKIAEEMRESSGDEESTPKSKRSRRKKTPPPPFDPNADPGEELDPTTTTMADICDDTGHGRVSSKAAEIQNNHLAWKAQNKARREGMKAISEKKKYGVPLDDDEVPVKTADPPSFLVDQGTVDDVITVVGADGDGDGYDYQQLSESRFNVQVRIGPNGETIIDEDSLVVDRVSRSEQDAINAEEGYTHIVESEHTKFTNSGTYSKRFRGSRWSREETEMFYDALQQYGENYELIAIILPGRDRKSCKNKFKAEDKKNPARINYCLKHRRPVDMTTLSRMTGKDFSGPVPEIRAPTPAPRPTANESIENIGEVIISQEQDEGNTANNGRAKKRKSKKASAAVAEAGVTVLGSVDTFILDDDD